MKQYLKNIFYEKHIQNEILQVNTNNFLEYFSF